MADAAAWSPFRMALGTRCRRRYTSSRIQAPEDNHKIHRRSTLPIRRSALLRRQGSRGMTSRPVFRHVHLSLKPPPVISAPGPCQPSAISSHVQSPAANIIARLFNISIRLYYSDLYDILFSAAGEGAGSGSRRRPTFHHAGRKGKSRC